MLDVRCKRLDGMWGLENVSHKNLDIWVLGIKLSKEIYKLTEQFPDCEKFGITSQLRRASVSIPANIAEGAARQTNKEFLSFLHITRGSISEVDTILVVCLELNYCKSADLEIIYKLLKEIYNKTNALIKRIKEKH